MNLLQTSVLSLGLCLPLSVAACSKHPQPEASTKAEPVASEAPEPPPDPSAEARKLFATKCVVCHGDHGAGDGPGAAALNPKPRAFADAMWQSNITDDQIKKTIVGGGASVGKSAAMPPNPDLADKPDQLTALVKIVRDFKH